MIFGFEGGVRPAGRAAPAQIPPPIQSENQQAVFEPDSGTFLKLRRVLTVTGFAPD